MTQYKGYIKYTPQKSKSSEDYVLSFQSILSFFKDLGHPLPQLLMDNETSLPLREFFQSHHLPV